MAGPAILEDPRSSWTARASIPLRHTRRPRCELQNPLYVRGAKVTKGFLGLGRAPVVVRPLDHRLYSSKARLSRAVASFSCQPSPQRARAAFSTLAPGSSPEANASPYPARYPSRASRRAYGATQAGRSNPRHISTISAADRNRASRASSRPSLSPADRQASRSSLGAKDFLFAKRARPSGSGYSSGIGDQGNSFVRPPFG